jgi:hypothetical protein
MNGAAARRVLRERGQRQCRQKAGKTCENGFDDQLHDDPLRHSS